MPQKIPCSVALITSRGEGIRSVLENLKDFGEIVVCHAGATEEALAVIHSFGAKVITQYDTDETGMSCVMDKAYVRERAMQASTLPWRFFMDRDDRLSTEAIQEIRAITNNPHPKHLIWRMPTRIFIDNREILHEATYPSYQTRLVHESVGAHFKGLVHDHLVWDAERFPPGTMQSYYNFHWSKERVAHYWSYLASYVSRELQTTDFHNATLRSFVYWHVYRRLRIILGYLLWRLPFMYARYGFRDSMPLSIELQIVSSHMWILVGSVWRFVATRRWLVFLSCIVCGKGLARARHIIALRGWEAYGRVLDIGGSPGEFYWRYLQAYRWHRDTFANETSELPDRYFDTVLLLKTPASEALLAEARRVTRKGGYIIGIATDGTAFRHRVD